MCMPGIALSAILSVEGIRAIVYDQTGDPYVLRLIDMPLTDPVQVKCRC